MNKPVEEPSVVADVLATEAVLSAQNRKRGAAVNLRERIQPPQQQRQNGAKPVVDPHDRVSFEEASYANPLLSHEENEQKRQGEIVSSFLIGAVVGGILIGGFTWWKWSGAKKVMEIAKELDY